MNNNIQAIRKIKGYTQKELAEHLDVSIQMISAWEKNPNEKIPEMRQKQIAEFLQVSVEELFSPEFDEQQFKMKTMTEEMEKLHKQTSFIQDKFEQEMKIRDVEHLVKNNEIDKLDEKIQEELKHIITLEKQLPSNRLLLLYRVCLLLNKTHAFSSTLHDFDGLLTLLEREDSKYEEVINMLVKYLTNDNSILRAYTFGSTQSNTQLWDDLGALLKKHGILKD